MKAIEQHWQQVLDATKAIRQQISTDQQDINEAERLIQHRDSLLRNLLSESTLSLLGDEELTWLQTQVNALQEEDALLRKALGAEQRHLQAELQQVLHKAKALKAYQQG